MFGRGRSRIRPPTLSDTLIDGLGDRSKPQKPWRNGIKFARGQVIAGLIVLGGSGLTLLAHLADLMAVFEIKPISTWFEPEPPSPDLFYEPDEEYKARGFEVDDLDLSNPFSYPRLEMLRHMVKDCNGQAGRSECSEAKDRDFQFNFERLIADEAGCATWVATHLRALHGLWELKLGRHSSAIDDFEKALELDSSNWHAKKFLVEVYEKRIQALEEASPQEQLELKKAYERALKRLRSELASQVAEFVRFVDARGRDDPSRLISGPLNIRNEHHYEDLQMIKRWRLGINKASSREMDWVGLLHASTSASRVFLVAGLNEPAGFIGDSFVPLDFAESDAHRVASTLRRAGFEGQELIGPQVTPEYILKSLAEINLSSRPGDELVIYLAGHGISSGDGYRGLVTERGVDRSVEAITIAAITRALENYRGEATVVLDACLNPRFSSSFDDVYLPLPRSRTSAAAERRGDTTVNLIFATQDGSKAIESRRFGGGLFTDSLVKFLAKGPQGSFDAEAACRYTTRETKQRALEVFGISQVPTCELRESQLN